MSSSLHPPTLKTIRYPAGRVPELKLTAEVEIFIDWPVTWRNTDPNFFYRAWLEENVGEQGLDWDWDYATVNVLADSLKLFFKRERDASLFLLVEPRLLKEGK